MLNHRFFCKLHYCLLLWCCLISVSIQAQPLVGYKTIEWTDLMPEEDVKLLESAPQVDHESMTQEELAQDIPVQSNNNLSAFEDQIAQAIADANKQASTANKPRTWKDALVSTAVRKEFNQKRIKLAGYISPITWDENNIVTELFFVPYFGACIHVPPPPPNQLIYVKLDKGMKLIELYEPFWVQGTLIVEATQKDIGHSAYSMQNASFAPYTEPPIE
jgi:uncharacterized protein